MINETKGREPMRKKLIALITVPLFALLILPIGCVEKKGPMEKAGEKIDKAVEKVGDKIEDAGDKVEDATDGH
jgi:hypothetical protein